MSTTIRVNSEIKEEVTPILSALGISVGDAVNIFLHQVKLQRGIPFDLTLRIPSPDFWNDVEETHKAIADETAKVYSTVDAFMEDIYGTGSHADLFE